MRTYQMEPLVRGMGGVKPEILTVRLRWESKECIRAYAQDRGMSLSDTIRHLLRRGLEAEGW